MRKEKARARLKNVLSTATPYSLFFASQVLFGSKNKHLSLLAAERAA
jgi:hypothetical protein